MALPEHFLRTPGWGDQGDSSHDPQVAADAKLAMMLQVHSLLLPVGRVCTSLG